jgi:putative oxidoreductase
MMGERRGGRLAVPEERRPPRALAREGDAMFRKLIHTDGGNIAAPIVRLALGIVIFPHGAQKALGWFGGQGFSATMGFFTEQMHIPYVLALLVVGAELLGSIGLIVGFLTRVAAFGIGCVMAGAVAMVHAPNGFFMNWFGTQQGEGFEYHILALGMAIALMIRGAGAVSVDAALSKQQA